MHFQRALSSAERESRNGACESFASHVLPSGSPRSPCSCGLAGVFCRLPASLVSGWGRELFPLWWGSQAFLFTAGSGTLRGAACWLVSCPTERGNIGCSTLTLSEASQAAASDSGLCLNIRPRKGRGVGGPSSALSRNHVSVAHLHKFLGPSTGSRAPSGDGPLLAMLLKATSQA